MANEADHVPAPAPVDAPSQPPEVVPAVTATPSRKEQAVELAVFLFLIVPSLVLSLFVIRQGQLDFVLTALATIFRDLGLVFLILFFLWRNGESVQKIGWTSQHLLREIGLGVALFLPVFLIAALLEWALKQAGLSAPSTKMPSFFKTQGTAEIVLAVVMVIVVAVAEETVFRGYLLLRLDGLLHSNTVNVLLSSAIFATGHGYEGTAGLLTVGVLGAIFAVIYLWRGSLVAPMVMHFLQDFVAIVLVQLIPDR